MLFYCIFYSFNFFSQFKNDLCDIYSKDFLFFFPKKILISNSKICIQFLDEPAKELNVDTQNAENVGESKINNEIFNCNFQADEYFQEGHKKFVVEFIFSKISKTNR